MRRLFYPLLLCLLLFGPASAHPIDEWFVDFQWTDGEGIQGRLRVPPDQTTQLLKKPFQIKAGSEILSLQLQQTGTDDDQRALVTLTGASTSRPDELTISVPADLMDENQSLIGFFSFGEGEPTTVLVPAGGSEVVRRPEPDQVAPGMSWFFRFGVAHIVEGYDHLLFLFCLLIAGGTLRHFLIVVTAFTVGHSVSLALSVLGYLVLPSRLTESVIALSIVVAALYNIPYLKRDQESEAITSRAVMALLFGLIHGLGFAGILTEIGVQGGRALQPLVGFNLGVEAGQLVLVALFYPLLRLIYRWKYKVPALLGCSYLAAALGLYWFAERAFS